MQSKREIDNIDCKILQTLMRDSRASFSEIAKETKTSISNIRNRFNRLQKDGIITGAVMDINPYALGYKTRATIRLRVLSTSLSETLEQLRSIPEILVAIKGFGRKNIICFALTHNTEELNQIVETIRNIPGVLETETNLNIGAGTEAHPENIKFR
ncbi:MAG: Lrp/AsnC family transcriptional regulator [Candidatus Bathyarchaeota archaeon]|nr:Lrp/AsnC family transcriptional regulator [Candidatus Bathyarchaeum sp.]